MSISVELHSESLSQLLISELCVMLLSYGIKCQSHLTNVTTKDAVFILVNMLQFTFCWLKWTTGVQQH